MRHRFVAALALLTGCGSGSAALASSTTTPSSEPSRQTTPLRDTTVDAPPQSRAPTREVVRIGSGRSAPIDDALTTGDVTLDESDGRDEARPMLRLHGSPRPAATSEGVTPYPGAVPPAIVPPPPSVTAFGRLPSMTTPDVPLIPVEPLVVIPETPTRPVPTDDAIVREYQAALAHIEARRFDVAIQSLASFVAAHPAHSYADNALYWQGEAHYARREYRQAIAVFERLLERYPDGNKVPDALVRLGDAFEHLGERARARDYFRRVREQYPDSVAARTARREEI